MKYKLMRSFFVAAIALALVFSCMDVSAAPQAAIGFIEDTSTGAMRLAFVQTQDGWRPSCFFTKDDAEDFNESDINIQCAADLMAQSWKVLRSSGDAVDIGSLQPMQKSNYSEMGLVAADITRTRALTPDGLSPERLTWMGETRPPMVAFTGGITLERIPAEDSALTAELRAKVAAAYLNRARTIAICDEDTGDIKRQWKASPKDLNIKAVARFPGPVSLVSVELKMPTDANCDEEDVERELFFVEGSQATDLIDGFPRNAGIYNTRLQIVGAFRVGDGTHSDAIYIAYVQGYDLDGYALFDSKGRLQAKSRWIYH